MKYYSYEARNPSPPRHLCGSCSSTFEPPPSTCMGAILHTPYGLQLQTSSRLPLLIALLRTNGLNLARRDLVRLWQSPRLWQELASMLTFSAAAFRAQWTPTRV